MKKIQVVINVIVVAAVAALFVVVYTGDKQEAPAVAVESSEVMPIAYLNVDSLLVNYTFAQEASERLMY